MSAHKSPTPRPQAVLWDFDGTLVDTEPVWIASDTATITGYGKPWTHDQAVEWVGASMEASTTYFASYLAVPGLDSPRLMREIEQMVADHNRTHPIPFLPGARELLDECLDADIPLALVTMSSPLVVASILDRMPGVFHAVVNGADVAEGKPHPEPYLSAAAALGVDPAHCLALEDSRFGCQSANAAGAVVIAVPSFRTIEPAPRRVIVDSLAGLTLDRAFDLYSGALA